MKNWLCITLFLVLPIANLSASNKDTLTSIHLTILDSATNEAVPFASAIVLCNNVVVETGTTDINGELQLTWQGKYDARQLTLKVVYAGYYNKVITGLDTNMKVVMKMEPTKSLRVYIKYTAQQIDQTSYKDSLTSIHLTIIDSETNQGVPFIAAVVLYNNMIVQTGQTDINGELLLTWTGKYDAGQLTLKVVDINYYDKVVTRLNSNMRVVMRIRPVRIIRDYIICGPPVIDQSGHTGTSWHKGDSPIY